MDQVLRVENVTLLAGIDHFLIEAIKGVSPLGRSPEKLTVQPQVLRSIRVQTVSLYIPGPVCSCRAGLMNEPIVARLRDEWANRG